MCGRTCLTLDPDTIVCACQYKSEQHVNNDTEKRPKGKNVTRGEVENKICLPEWRSEFNCGRKYIPSYNIAPTDITPVLISSAHFSDDDGSSKKHKPIIVPMMWGMIPFWHKGNYRKHGLTTHNCRLEHMLESKLYRGVFQRGQRCVVLCEGFYEWQTTKSTKSSERDSYYLYMKQVDEIEIHDKNTWKGKNVNLLKMAGLFDVWDNENGDKMFSYSIITFGSSKNLEWLHHRMPAILDSDEQVNDWLDFERVKDKEALKLLQPTTNLKWHQVSKIVNNARNKSEECNKPITKDSKRSTSQKRKGSILSWLYPLSEDTVKEGSNNNDSELDNKLVVKKARFEDEKI